MVILILDILALVFLVYLVSNLLYYFRIILIVSGIVILILALVYAIRCFRKQKNKNIDSKIQTYNEETSPNYNDFTIDTNIVGDAEKESIEANNEKQNRILEKEKIKKEYQTEKHNSSMSREETFIYGAYCNKELRHRDIQCMEEEYKKYALFSYENKKIDDKEKETE